MVDQMTDEQHEAFVLKAIEDAYAQTAEDSPNLEQEQQEAVEPDATGSTSSDDSLSEEELDALATEGENNVPGPRFKQLNEQRKAAKAEAEKLKAEIAELRQQQSLPDAIREALKPPPAPVQPVVDPDDQFYIDIDAQESLAEIGEGVSPFSSEMEKKLYERDKNRHFEFKAIKQQTITTQQQTAKTEFDATIAVLEAKGGVKLTPEQMQQVLLDAADLENGSRNRGMQVTVAAVTTKAFNALVASDVVAKASEASRAAAIRENKAAITQARPGSTKPAPVKQDWSKMTERQATEAAVNQAFAEAGMK